ncbi:MAG: mitochondrial fission ELM1 family protein, partial [Candidatus Omnitrophica bacterium]|nr:mitochondrial fission ELM1 family protein [Candidatus Omnitrophota bacterium]
MLDWIACLLVKATSALFCRLPAAFAVWMGERLGTLAFWLQPSRTRIGMSNVRAAFDGKLSRLQCRRIVKDCYRQLGAGLFELLRLPVMDQAYVEKFIQIEGRAYLDEALASGRPIVLLTGHFGNWELSSIVAALLGRPIVALARAQEKMPRLYRLLVSFRESKGCTVVHKGGAMKRLIAALDQGRMIGIVADQASRQGVFMDFFGRPALFATGPFELAWSKRALVICTFTHRLRGPFHRIVLEPPLTLSQDLPKEQAIRGGMEQFAAILEGHIRQAPGQWLWMHKRWKHTPQRKVLVLNDGKLGHLKQSLVVLELLRERFPQMSFEIIDVAFRHSLGRMLALLWSGLLPGGPGSEGCLAHFLTPESAKRLLNRYADIIVSCGAATIPVNVLWARANRARSIVLMNPAPVPLTRFDLVISPHHDRLPRRSNVVFILGALAHRLTVQEKDAAVLRLKTHPCFRDGEVFSWPTVAVLFGGETPDYCVPSAFAETFVSQIRHACEAAKGECLVTTSRRTPAAIERILEKRFFGTDFCRFLLLASRDPIEGTLDAMLGLSDVAVVTAESISMISEACASGKPVLAVELPLRSPQMRHATRQQRFLRELSQKGYIRVVQLPE